MVADDTFPLKNTLMKRYCVRGLSADERMFNYKLGRAQRNVENVFKILATAPG